jgi:hypothetical protein
LELPSRAVLAVSRVRHLRVRCTVAAGSALWSWSRPVVGKPFGGETFRGPTGGKPWSIFGSAYKAKAHPVRHYRRTGGPECAPTFGLSAGLERRVAAPSGAAVARVLGARQSRETLPLRTLGSGDAPRGQAPPDASGWGPAPPTRKAWQARACRSKAHGSIDSCAAATPRVEHGLLGGANP